MSAMSCFSLIVLPFLILLSQDCYRFSGETIDVITGFLNEPLHLDCSKQRTANKEDFVARQLSEYNSSELNIFVSSRWEQGNYTKVCINQHSLHELCSSQVTSYVTNNQVTHFVIKSAPKYLNGSETLCEYSGVNSSSRPQIIKLQGRIKGHVNGRIEMKCHIPYRCNESESVALKFNLTEVKIVDVNHANSGFPCIENEKYYNVCRDHMNLSYVNGSCSVVFVFEKTPVSLNNTHLHCHVKFRDVDVDADHDDLETIIYLQYQQSDTLATTALTHLGTSVPETTTTQPITTPSAKDKNIPSSKKDNKHLSAGEIAGIIIAIIIGIPVIVIVLVVLYKKCERRGRHDNGGINHRNEDPHEQQAMWETSV